MNESRDASDAESASSNEAVTVPPAAPPSEQATQSASEAPPSTAGHPAAVPGYEILRELGRGGMGVVYQARHIKLDRVVALKMILAGGHAGEADLARFKTEGEAVARLQHPNIVQIFEVGEHGGLPFFSLEFCGGGSLDKKLAATPLRPKEAAGLVETLARAVHAAHQQKVIHRDLKPANVLLTEAGTPKITDFGLAKKLDAAGGTHTGAVMGTPSYMAPEQAGGKTAEMGPACDVYALGAILYECVTGRPPFKAATPLDTIMQVVSDDPVPPRQLQSKTPRDLETICLKCLEKQPGRRYGTALALAEDLARLLDGEPVRARPPSLGYVLGKQIRRHRRPLAVVVGMLLLLAAVVTTAFLLVLGAWRTAQKNYETADKNAKDLKRQLSLSARIAAGRSDAEVWAGNLRDSLSWMLEAYELAPREDPQRPYYLRRIGRGGRGLSDLALWHDKEIFAASFSPDGRTVLTASADKTARLWDAASGKELQRLTHDDEVYRASFSPDGRTVLTHGKDMTVRLWNAASGKELTRFKHDSTGGSDPQLWAASFSPDSRTVVTASTDKTARLWDAATGKELQRLTHQGEVHAASFSPDGRTVVTASGEAIIHRGDARLWDAASGKELQRLTHDGPAYAALFSPDGRTVLTASTTGIADKAWLWDVSSGKELQRLTLESPMRAASFSPDGSMALIFGHNTARLWDVATGTDLQRLARNSVAAELARNSPLDGIDWLILLAAEDETTARLWDARFLSVPADVDPDRLRAWVLVRTGQNFTEEGKLRPLSKQEWEQQRRTLEAKGGDWQRAPDPRKWHLVEAADAEAHQAWFAARFHLNWLLKDDPNNADLLRRRDEAEKHLKAP